MLGLSDGSSPRMLFKLICLISFLSFNVVAGRCEPLKPLVNISIDNPSKITIEAQMPKPGREWSFRNAYAGALNLADRIDNFEVIGATGESLTIRKVTVGEYRSDQPAQSFRYTVIASSRGVAEVS